MELLIVLGLCFGAYELLGVFQGCFHYNDHPLPYQPQAHNNNINSNNSLNDNNDDDTKDNDNENDNDKSDEYQCERRKLDKSEIRRQIQARKLHQHKQQLQIVHHQNQQLEYANDEIEEDDEEILKSGSCSCYSTLTEDDFDDDTRTILRNYNNRMRKQQALRKPINKFSLSKSLMSLNRDDSNFLFNYLDDTNNRNKFSKFKSEIEISETSFNSCINLNNKNNERRKTRNSRDNFDIITSAASSSSTSFVSNEKHHNEINESNASVNLDTNKKKIFFISAAS